MASSKMQSSFDVLEVNHERLTEELIDSMDSRVPLYIWGPPGIGKSVVCNEVAKNAAKKKGKFYIDWNRAPRAIKHALRDGELGSELLQLMIKPEPPKSKTTKPGEKPAKVEHSHNPADDIPSALVSGLMVASNERMAKDFIAKKKSATVADCFIFADYRLSQRDPSDINGLPSINSRDYVEWRPTLLFSVLSMPEADGMLFFDEIPQAMPVVQNAAYQLIQDRCCGEISFSDKIVVIAAGNRLTDGGNQFQIPPALANRFTHVELMAPTIEKWADWGIDHNVDSRIIAFLRFKPSYLMDSMDDVRKKRAMAWCSPRSWEKASDKIKGFSGAGEKSFDRIYGKVAMACGKARATEFRGFIKTTVSLNIKDILAHPEKAKSFEIGIKWALISAVSEYYREDKKFLDDILGLCRHLSADFSVSMLRMMRRYDRTQFATRLAKCKNKEVVLDYMKYFED